MVEATPGYKRRWRALIGLDDAAWAEISAKRNAFEWAFVPDPIADSGKQDDSWNPYANGVGDCEDWSLAMRAALIAAGFPRDALLMAVCRTQDGQDHAVLVIATDRGDFIADVRHPAIMPWAETGYQWIAVEGAGGTWSAIQKAITLADLQQAAAPLLPSGGDGT
jgi:predicted transglutaminase-like cysteine proteinase